jgi:hypothetical protein
MEANDRSPDEEDAMQNATVVNDPVPHAAPTHRPYIVACPACKGKGRLLRDGSQVHLSCRLCWERGVVARIVADKYLRARHSPADGGRGDTR